MLHILTSTHNNGTEQYINNNSIIMPIFIGVQNVLEGTDDVMRFWVTALKISSVS